MLGHSGLMIPMAILIGLTLALSRGTGKLALWWTLFWGATGGLVLATKLAFFIWCLGNAQFDFTGLSGHAALAALIWPAALWLLTANRSAFSVAVWVSVGFLLGAAIAFSRWFLHDHSMSEAIIGFVVGSLFGLGFLYLVRGHKLFEIRYVGIASIALVLLVLVQHSQPTPTQEWIWSATTYLTGEAPFRRQDLHLNTGTSYLGQVPAPLH